MSEPISRTYRAVMAGAWPVVRWWGRLEVSGLEQLPASGPVVVFSNHDSAWDPVIVGCAGKRRRQIRALARSSLWKNPVMARVLDGMGQIPIERGRGDAAAIATAVERLAEGACIGVFPEGTLSRGRTLRARSGAARLAAAVPDARIVCVAVTGAVDIVRFPKRPRLRVAFFEPAGGQPGKDEPPGEVAARITKEIRTVAPVVMAGRKKKAAAWARKNAADES